MKINDKKIITIFKNNNYLLTGAIKTIKILLLQL